MTRLIVAVEVAARQSLAEEARSAEVAAEVLVEEASVEEVLAAEEAEAVVPDHGFKQSFV